MKPIDFLKALGVAIAVLALNMLVLTGVIFAWSMLIETGHPPEYYSAAAPGIGAWVAPPTGALLLLLANWRLGLRRPERNAMVFAAVTWLGYLAVDLLVGLGMSPLSRLLTLQFGVSMLAALAGALAGGALARRKA